MQIEDIKWSDANEKYQMKWCKWKISYKVMQMKDFVQSDANERFRIK